MHVRWKEEMKKKKLRGHLVAPPFRVVAPPFRAGKKCKRNIHRASALLF